jgi:hypothetical protein
MSTDTERLTIDTIVSDSMIQEVAELIAYSGLFGDPIDMLALHDEQEKAKEEVVVKPRKPRKVNPNKVVKGKTKAGGEGSTRDFWLNHGDDGYDMVRDDSILSQCQTTGGNYEKTKIFLRTDWKHREFFTRTELEKALTEKYPEESSYNSNSTFRVQHRGWAFGVYYVLSGDMAVKPIFRRIGRGKFENVFYVEE